MKSLYDVLTEQAKLAALEALAEAIERWLEEQA